jgi:hypothetical protein
LDADERRREEHCADIDFRHGGALKKQTIFGKIGYFKNLYVTLYDGQLAGR